MSLTPFERALVAHLVADWLLQNDWMAHHTVSASCPILRPGFTGASTPSHSGGRSTGGRDWPSAWCTRSSTPGSPSHGGFARSSTAPMLPRLRASRCGRIRHSTLLSSLCGSHSSFDVPRRTGRRMRRWTWALVDSNRDGAPKGLQGCLRAMSAVRTAASKSTSPGSSPSAAGVA